MKKLWSRFKKWLIQKLGGYVDPPPPFERFVVKTVVARPEMLTVEQAIPCYDALDVRDYAMHETKQFLASQIVSEMMRNRLIQWICHYEPARMEFTLRARVLVCAPPRTGEMTGAVECGIPIGKEEEL